MLLLINGLFLGGVIVAMYRKNRPDLLHWQLVWALGAKLMATVALLVIYLHHYQAGDVLTYHEIANRLNDSAGTSFSNYLSSLVSHPLPELADQPRSRFFVKLISPLLLFTGGNLWLASVWVSILVFTVHWWAYVRLKVVFQEISKLFFFVLFFTPTAVFWSSGLTKDALSSACVVLLFTGVTLIARRELVRKWEYVLLVISLACLVYLKQYVLLAFMVSSSILIIEKLVTGRWWIRLGSYAVVAITLMIGSRFLHGYLTPERLPLTVYENYTQILDRQGAQADFTFDLEPTYSSLMANAPLALFTGLFRPLPWEASNWLQLLVSLENVALMVFGIWTLVRYRNMVFTPEILALLCYVAILAVLLSLSVPNFGSLSRYKSIFLPQLALLVGILPYRTYFGQKGS